MNFKQVKIDKFLKNPDASFKGVIIYGSNEGLVSEYVKSFTAAICKDIYDPFQTAYLDMETLSSDKTALVAEYNAQSLMGGRRVVVLKNADGDLAKLMPQILESKSDTFLVAYSTTLKKKSALVSMAETDGRLICVACYEDRDESIYATARQMFIDNGYTISSDALQLLYSRLSADRKTNIGEIEKLITYVGSKKNIEAQDVANIVGELASFGLEDIAFYAASGDTQKALAAYEKLLKEGAEPVSITRNLMYHFNRLLVCKSYMEEGTNVSSAAAKLKPQVIFFRKEAFENQLRFWSREKILDVFELLFRAERDCKTTNMPNEQIVSYLIMQIASAARRQRNSR